MSGQSSLVEQMGEELERVSGRYVAALGEHAQMRLNISASRKRIGLIRELLALEGIETDDPLRFEEKQK